MDDDRWRRSSRSNSGRAATSTPLLLPSEPLGIPHAVALAVVVVAAAAVAVASVAVSAAVADILLFFFVFLFC